MGLFDQFVGGAPPTEEEREATPQLRITVRPPGVPDQPPTNQFEQFTGGAKPPEQIATESQPQLNKPFGELRPRDPMTWTEWLKSKGQDALIAMGAEPYRARHMSDAVVNIGGFTPMGSVLSAADATHNVQQGNYGHAALDTVGALPLVGPTIARGYRASRGIAQPAERTIRMAETPSVQELEGAARAGYRFSERSPVEYHPDSLRDFVQHARNYLQAPYRGRGVFTPEGNEQLYGLLNRFEHNFPGTQPPRPPVNLGFNPNVTHQPPPPVPRAVTTSDYDTLRQQLRGLTGSDGAGGQQLANLLDAWMLNPSSRITRGSAQDLADLRNSFMEGRGNWRSAKTSEGVQDAIDYGVTSAGTANSGLNTGNRVRQKMGSFVTSDAGAAKLPGATPAELEAITNAATGDWLTNRLRSGSNLLGGGGGLGRLHAGGGGAGVGGAAALAAGLDPVTAAAIAAATGAVAPMAGAAMRSAATGRTLRAGNEVAADIARNSPLYRAREAVNPPVVDPRNFRDRIAAYLMAPTIRQQGNDALDEAYVPYANR